MGLKSLLIVLVLFGAKSSSSAIISALLIFVISILNLATYVLLKKDETFAVSIIMSAIVAATIGIILSSKLPLWYETHKNLIYTLPVVPIAMLEYINTEKKIVLKEVFLFLQAMVFIGFLKELLAYGSIFSQKLLPSYEGMIFFDTNAGTLLLIGLTLIIYDRLGESKWYQ